MFYAVLGLCSLGAGVWLGGKGIPAFKKRIAQATLNLAVNSIAALPEDDKKAMAKAVLAGMKSVARPSPRRVRRVAGKPVSAEAEAPAAGGVAA
ncbi:MAG: hypothetical protein NUW23_02415 [Firmicutes bacterium]|nr:hypothetical protein [Bacillota bacterium]